MSHQPFRRRSSGVAFALGLALLSSVAAFTPARALDATLDNVVVQNSPDSSVRLGKVEFVGANLTQDELTKLFAAGVSPEERRALVAKLKADRISIPEAVATNKDGSKMTATNIVATGVADGKAARIAAGSLDLTGKGDDGAPMAMKSGALAVENSDLSGLLDPASGKYGFSRFTWDGVDMTFADKNTPATTPGGNMVNLKIASMAIDAAFDAGVLTKTGVNVKGLSVTPPAGSDAGKQLAAFGYGKVDLGLAFAGVFDPAAKTYSIDDMTIDSAGMGAVKLKAKFAGIDKGAFSGAPPEMMMALMSGGVGAVEITYADAGLAQKGLAFAAGMQQKQPAALQAETAAMAKQLTPMLLPGAANAAAIGDALSRFIAAPASITVTLKPKAGAIGVMELAQITDPAAFTAKIDLDVQTTSAATGAAPAAAAPAAPAAGRVASAPQAAAPAAAPALSGMEAWNAIVGNTVTGKNSDGDEVSEYYLRSGVVMQQSDGEVSTGKWAFKGGKVCVEFPDNDDEDEGETCYRVTLQGDVATFTDDDDEKTTYKLLPGNAKNM